MRFKNKSNRFETLPGNVYGQGGGGGGGIPSINVKQVVTLSARIRLNGQEACSESREIGFLEGQEYPICGGIAIYKGGQTYFRIQNSPGIWVNSPSHCGGFPQSCRHYWNSNW